MGCKNSCYDTLRYCYLEIAILDNKVLVYVSVSMGHNLASSFRLFRLQKFFLHIIANFSKIHNIHLFANVILTQISMVTGFTALLIAVFAMSIEFSSTQST